MKATKLSNENKYNLLMGRVPLLLNRFLVKKFKDNDIYLTREQWSILAVLWKNDGCSQQALAEATYRDKPSITRLIDNLEKEGYVERKADKNDRRLNLIFLTQKGRDIEIPMMKIVNETIDIATTNLTEEQILNIRDSFQLIFENINKELS